MECWVNIARRRIHQLEGVCVVKLSIPLNKHETATSFSCQCWGFVFSSRAVRHQRQTMHSETGWLVAYVRICSSQLLYQPSILVINFQLVVSHLCGTCVVEEMTSWQTWSWGLVIPGDRGVLDMKSSGTTNIFCSSLIKLLITGVVRWTGEVWRLLRIPYKQDLGPVCLTSPQLRMGVRNPLSAGLWCS